MRVITQSILKQCIIIFALSVVSLQTYSQGNKNREIKADPRLYECFSKEYVESLADNPRLLLYYNFYLDHAWFLNEPNGKPSQGIDISSVKYKETGPDGQIRYFDEDVTKFDPKKFCALKYSFKPSQEGFTHYLLGNTGKVLIFYPARDFNRKYNEYLKSYGFDTAK